MERGDDGLLFAMGAAVKYPMPRFAGAADLTTSTLTGTLTLPPATGSFKELGLVPVSRGTGGWAAR